MAKIRGWKKIGKNIWQEQKTKGEPPIFYKRKIYISKIRNPYHDKYPDTQNIRWRQKWNEGYRYVIEIINDNKVLAYNEWNHVAKTQKEAHDMVMDYMKHGMFTK